MKRRKGSGKVEVGVVGEVVVGWNEVGFWMGGEVKREERRGRWLGGSGGRRGVGRGCGGGLVFIIIIIIIF